MSYTPYYPGGWKSGEAGGTPVSPAALNHMDKGIAAAMPAEKLVAVYGAPVDFVSGIGYYENSNIVAGLTVAFVQLRAASVETVANTVLGVTAESGRLKIVMDHAQTVAGLPVNILMISP